MKTEKRTVSYFPAAGAFLMMMAMSLGTTALSFFNEPVSTELEIGRGSFTVYYSLLTASGAFSAPFVGQFVSRHGVRPVIALSSVWCCAGFFVFSFSTSLWAFYVTAIVMGILCISCASLCANVTVQTSYPGEKAASLLGIVMSGSGVGGVLTSMVLPGVLEQYGWRVAYRVLGCIWLMLVLLAVFLIGKPTNHRQTAKNTDISEGITRAEALRSASLYLIIGIGILLSAACGITTQIPSVLASIGFSAAQAGLLMSVMTGAIALGKILQGVLYGKIGLSKGGILTISVFIISFWMLTQKPLAVPALILMAVGVGIVTTLLPLSAREAFGPREYAGIYGIISLGATCGNFLAAPVWGAVYDVFGSYIPGLAAMPFLLIAALILHVVVCKKIGK